jgi:hypothetical protein
MASTTPEIDIGGKALVFEIVCPTSCAPTVGKEQAFTSDGKMQLSVKKAGADMLPRQFMGSLRNSVLRLLKAAFSK